MGISAHEIQHAAAVSISDLPLQLQIHFPDFDGLKALWGLSCAVIGHGL